MRTLAEIKEDAAQLEKRMQDLKEEHAEFINACPHPNHFVKYKVTDFDDGGMGIPNYDFSNVKYKCALCEGSWSERFDRHEESMPTLTEILEKQVNG